MSKKASAAPMRAAGRQPGRSPAIQLAAILLAALALCSLAASFAAATRPAVDVLTIDGAIGPAMAEYVERGLGRAAADGAQLVVLDMDTPGGLDTSMRRIVKAILASPVPVATYVAPGGARAASAGTYILYASHVAAMAPGTNLGAATPVQIGGAEPGSAPGPGAAAPAEPDRAAGKAERRAGRDDAGAARRDGNAAETDRGVGASPPTMRQKAINDAAAYIRGLADLRGRNARWAEQAVREAVSLSAEEALKLRVIDYVAADLPDLLRQADGRKVVVQGQEQRLRVLDATVARHAPDWRMKLLAAVTDPSVALILLMIGAYGLIFEFFSPGTAVPGVVGAICLLVGLYALQLLPINYAGLGLILLGVALMVAEAFLPSFGAIGIGGVAAFVAGAVILIDTDLPGFGIPVGLIVSIAVSSAVLIGAAGTIALKARRRPVVTGAEQLIGATAEILEDAPDGSWARVHGELWRVVSRAPLQRGQKMRVLSREGLVLTVAPAGRDEMQGG